VLSPDVTRLAFTVRDEKSKVLLYVRSLTSLTAQPLPGTDDAIYPFWSPDSRQIGFFAAGKLKKINVNANGGPPQDISDSVSGRGGTWSKDGVIVFTPSSNQNLFSVPAAGGTPEPASKLDVSKGENSHRWPWSLPDGKHFLYWSRTSRPGESPVLYIGELGSFQAKLLTKSETMAQYASGHLLTTFPFIEYDAGQYDAGQVAMGVIVAQNPSSSSSARSHMFIVRPLVRSQPARQKKQ
jgi:Tol biopolymer transport system component